MQKQKQKIPTHTWDGIPHFRRFDGERYFLIGGRFRTKENVMRFAMQIRTPYPKGIGAGSEKTRVVKNPNGKTWLIYRTGEPRDWKGIDF